LVIAAVARDEAFGEVKSAAAREREERWGLGNAAAAAAAVADDDDNCVIWVVVLSLLSRELMSPLSS
jgi:hypothetical protein